MTNPRLTPLPPPPLPTDAEAVFDDKAGASLLAQQKLVTELNGQILPHIEQQTSAAASSASASAGSAAASEASNTAAAEKVTAAAAQVALAAERATEAGEYADTASAYSQSAAVSASAAAAAAGLPELAGKRGKSLIVNTTGDGVLWADPYPSFAGHAYKCLQVSPDEEHARWADVGQRIGDVLLTARTPTQEFLPADGSIYLKSLYPELYEKLGLIGGTKASAWSSVTSGFGTATISGLDTDDNGTWIAVGGGNARISRDDGLTWQPITAMNTVSGLAVAYLGRSSWLISAAGSKQYVWISTDSGVTWEQRFFTNYSGGYSVTKVASDRDGTIVMSHIAGIFYSHNYGGVWASASRDRTTKAAAVGANKRIFMVTESDGVYGSGAQSRSPILYKIDPAKAPVSIPLPPRESTDTAAWDGYISADSSGVIVTSLNKYTLKIEGNGDGGIQVNTFLGNVATDGFGTWVVGNQISTDNGSTYKANGLTTPLPVCMQGSRTGVFLAGGASGALLRSVPTFPYDSATQFALPNIRTDVGVSAYIKAKEV